MVAAGNSKRRRSPCHNPHTKSATEPCKSRSGETPARKATGTASFPAAATRKATSLEGDRQPRLRRPARHGQAARPGSHAGSSSEASRRQGPQSSTPVAESSQKNPFRQPPEPGAGGRIPCPPAFHFNHQHSLNGDYYDLHSMHTYTTPAHRGQQAGEIPAQCPPHRRQDRAWRN